MYCSKPFTFHNGFMFFASRRCFQHSCRFQALTAQTDREENVNNKIRATTTHVKCVVHDQEGHRSQPDNICHLIVIILSKHKACDCYCHLIRNCRLKKHLSACHTDSLGAIQNHMGTKESVEFRDSQLRAFIAAQTTTLNN